MTQRDYYRFGSYVLALVCVGMMVFAVYLFRVERSDSDELGKEMTLSQELRAYRQLLYDIRDARTAEVSDGLRSICSKDVNEINALIDHYESNRMDEYDVRVRLMEIMSRVSDDPFISIAVNSEQQRENAAVVTF